MAPSLPSTSKKQVQFDLEPELDFEEDEQVDGPHAQGVLRDEGGSGLPAAQGLYDPG